MSLQQKIDYSINLLRRAEPMALRMSGKREVKPHEGEVVIRFMIKK